MKLLINEFKEDYKKERAERFTTGCKVKFKKSKVIYKIINEYGNGMMALQSLNSYIVRYYNYDTIKNKLIKVSNI